MKIITSLSAPKQVVAFETLAEKKVKKNIFFNQSIPISELKYLGEIDTIPEENDHVSELKSWERNQKQVEKWMSKSTSAKPSDPDKFHMELQKLRRVKIITPEEINLTPPPPGFFERSEIKAASPEKKKRWIEFSSDSELSGTSGDHKLQPIKIPVQTSEVILQAPPDKPSIVKREKRSTFDNEKVSDNYYVGKLKFYNLKKRFGFATLENGDDVFLVEDELVLSGLLLRKFKDDVFNEKLNYLKFKIKTRTDNGKVKKIATSVEILS